MISTPAVAGGAVYFGSTDGRLYAVEAGSGTVRWKFQTQGPVNSSPLVAEGLVYFGSVDGSFYAVDIATGKEKWKFATAGERRFTAPGIHGIIPRTELMPDPFDVFLSSPAVRDGVVYFPTSDGAMFRALEASTGKVIFNLKNKDVSVSSPAIVQGVAYYGTRPDGWLHSIDLKTGQLLREFQTDGNKENASKYLDKDGKPDERKFFSEPTLDGIIAGLSRKYTMGAIFSSPGGGGWRVVRGERGR